MYASLDFYRNTYQGRAASDETLTKWLGRATDDIDALTDYQIDIEALPTAFADLVKKAECAQAEYLLMKGDTMQDAALSGASVGGFSYSAASGASGAVDRFSPRARQYLAGTGYLYAGVARW